MGPMKAMHNNLGGQSVNALIENAVEFYRRGWMWGTSGNLSVKVAAEPQAIAITGSGVSKGEITHADLAIVPEEAREEHPWLGPAGAKASAETPLHLAVYQHLPDVGAVFHVHTVASSLLSMACSSKGEGPWALEIAGFEMLKGWGIDWQRDSLKAQVPVLPNRASMEKLAEEFHRVLAQGPAVPAILVAGHGLTVWGSTPREARNRLEVAEFLCQALWQQRPAQP